MSTLKPFKHFCMHFYLAQNALKSSFSVLSKNLENFSSRWIFSRNEADIFFCEFSFYYSHTTGMLTLLLTAPWRFIPAVAVSLGANLCRCERFSLIFRHSFAIHYCQYIVVSFHFNSLQIALKECVLPCILGQMPAKVAFAPSPRINHVYSSYSRNKRHSSTRP